jgi:hypothetical protein
MEWLHAFRVFDALTIHDETDGIAHLERASAKKRLHAQIAFAGQLREVLPRVVTAALKVSPHSMCVQLISLTLSSSMRATSFQKYFLVSLCFSRLHTCRILSCSSNT